jgi:hypothetical protein
MEKTIGELIQSYDNALKHIKELEDELKYYKKELENREDLLKRTNNVEDMVKDIVSNEIILPNESISEEDTESEDEIKEKKIELVIKTKKGRPSKYKTDEERKAAKDKQDKERRERNKSAK